MTSRTAALSVLAAAALALTACGGDGSTSSEPMESVAPIGGPETSDAPRTPAAEPSPIETTEATTEPAEPTSPRGNLIAEIGQTGEVSTMEGDLVAEFTVKDISPGVCTEPYQSPAENGSIWFVTIDVVTQPLLEDPMAPTISADSYSWGYISPENTRFNGPLATVATYSCLPEAATIPTSIGPGENITGVVVLDVPADTGTLTFEPSYGAGFEYAF